jgi:prepilin-type N-terminal cleavage/methylation domain-containing protein
MARTCQRQRGRRGFTLTELMLAILVLGISLSMAAALFSAAAAESNTSLRRIMGTVIAENGLSIARAKLKYDAANNQVYTEDDKSDAVAIGTTMTDITDSSGTDLLGLDKYYTRSSDGAANLGYGLKVLAMQVTASENDFLLVALPYKLADGPSGSHSNVGLGTISASFSEEGGTSQGRQTAQMGGANANVKRYAAVVNQATGEYTEVVGLEASGSEATVTHAITDGSCYVLYESGKRVSPSLGALSTRTALKEE